MSSSLRSLDDILHRTINYRLQKIAVKSGDGSSAPPSEIAEIRPSSPNASSQRVRTSNAHVGGLNAEKVDELRNLASQMTTNIVYRLAAHAPEWISEDAFEGSSLDRRARGLQPRVGPRKSEACKQLEDSCKELEETLRRKRAEVVRRQDEVLGKCKSEFGAILNVKEQEILEVQRSVATGENSSSYDVDMHSEQFRQEFASQVEQTRLRLEDARKAVAALDGKKKGLDSIEALQRRGPYAAMQGFLAKCGANGVRDSRLDVDMLSDDEDEDDAQLAALVERSEQVAKRLRRIHAGA